MCDYSLAGLPSRLAVERDKLTTCKFKTGSWGLADPEQIRAALKALERPRGFKRLWQEIQDAIKNYDRPQEPAIEAVCVPPGAKLLLEEIPTHIQRKYHVDPTEEVTFDQISAEPHQHRDAFRFPNGTAVLIQEFGPGPTAKVVSLARATEREMVAEPGHAFF